MKNEILKEILFNIQEVEQKLVNLLYSCPVEEEKARDYILNSMQHITALKKWLHIRFKY